MKENEIFQQDAKSIVNMLFEGKIFRDGITRDDMNFIQNYIEQSLESRFQLYLSGQKFLKTIETFKMNNPELI